MIIARNFRIRTAQTSAFAECDLIGPGFPERLSFEVSIDQVSALDVEEPNWAAMTLLYPAMLMGEELVIEADLSALLLQNMRNDLMALIRNFEPKAKQIRIEAGQSSRLFAAAGRDVMSGFSAGVDSFATLAIFSDQKLHKDLRLTALGTFHVGALGPTHGHPELLKGALDLIRPIAEEKGLRLYGVSCDMDAIYDAAKKHGPVSFPKTVGFRNAAAGMALQNGVRVYMTAGQKAYNRASYGPAYSIEALDPVFQPLLHTESLRMVPVAAGLSRLDKMKMLVDCSDARAHLNPCVTQMDLRQKTGHLNCSRCWKCTATLLDLEFLGRLEDFRKVFEVDYYKENRAKLLANLLNISVHEWGNGSIEEAYGYALDAGLHLPRVQSRAVYRGRKFANRAWNMAGRVVRANLGRLFGRV
jgi:hypothetical protein